MAPNRAGTESYLRFGNKAYGLGKMESKQSSQLYVTQDQGVIGCASGAQEMLDIWTIGHPTEYQHVCKQVNQMNYGGALTSTANTNFLLYTTDAYIKNVETQLSLTNNANVPVTMELYDLVPKRDAWQVLAPNNLTSASNTPYNAIFYGLEQQQYQGSINEPSVIGVRPTDSKRFNQNWQIKKVTYTQLAPGQVHTHRVIYRVNRKIDYGLVEQFTSGGFFEAKGRSLVTLVIVRGGPMYLTVAGNATTAACMVPWVRTTRYHFTSIRSAFTQIDLDNSLTAVAPTVQTTGIMNLTTGAGSNELVIGIASTDV